MTEPNIQNLRVPVKENSAGIVELIDMAFEQGAVELRSQGREAFVFPDHDVYVPEVMFNDGEPFTDEVVDPAELETDIEDQLASQGWELWSKGMSNQDRYDGGWMHACEVLSEGMVTRMLREGGMYAIVYPPYSSGGEPDSWGVIRKVGS